MPKSEDAQQANKESNPELKSWRTKANNVDETRTEHGRKWEGTI